MTIPMSRLLPALALLAPGAFSYTDENRVQVSRNVGVGLGMTTTASHFALTTPTSMPTSSICEARTVNYITHMLPQSCLTSSWGGGFESTTIRFLRAEPSLETPITDELHEVSLQSDSATSSTETSHAEPTPSSFMSFEDWKEIVLRRAGQDPQEWRSRKLSQQQADHKFAPDDAHHSGLGEEGEISIDFVHYGNRDQQGSVLDHLNDREGEAAEDASLPYGDTVIHRSRDAGKTCKERFSYASFDAGATVLKSATGAKNARAILVENKDTYMLLECAVPSKYVIVELSDDILIDTVVIANFEFFSSMIRHFRVSVSDRYPVKMDKWRELGVFEARNSRDIQPFLVKNPQIWAKYIRIEFLTHFGNEYYCPVSLLRVHGSRMLDSWKDSETGSDEDLQVDGQEASKNLVQCDMTSIMSESINVTGDKMKPTAAAPWMIQLGADLFDTWSHATCPATIDRATHRPSNDQATSERDDISKSSQPVASAVEQPQEATTPTQNACTSIDETSPSVPTTAPTGSFIVSPSDVDEAAAGNFAGAIKAGSTAAKETARDCSNATVTSTTKSSAPLVANGKPRTSGATGLTGSSTAVQEGFFNAVTKRLQQVETNLTLSLKYVEEQSRHVQEALQRGEQKQRFKVTSFLHDLNQTVLFELRSIRDQYDQIWQSTVLALDSQADRSEQDIMALSSRLNLLAEEVVFQKRMAILQAVILLSCLFLVIFSRGVPASPLVPLPGQTTSNALYDRSAAFHHQVYAGARRQRHDTPQYTQSIHPLEARNASASSGSLSSVRLSGDIPSTSSENHGLPQPLTGGIPDQSGTTAARVPGRDSLCATDDKPSRSFICSSQIMTPRKPLPPLPEHPASSHDA